MAMHRSASDIHLSMSHFDVTAADGDGPVQEPHVIIDFSYEEICRTHSCSQTCRLKLKNTTRMPVITTTLRVPFFDLMLSKSSQYHLLPQGSSAVYNLIERAIDDAVRKAAERAFFAGVGVLGVAAKAKVVTDWFEPAEFCSSCLMDVEPKEEAIRMRCGHSYHEECMPYSGKEGRYRCLECFSGNMDPLIKMKPLDLVDIKLAGDLFDE